MLLKIKNKEIKSQKKNFKQDKLIQDELKGWYISNG